MHLPTLNTFKILFKLFSRVLKFLEFCNNVLPWNGKVLKICLTKKSWSRWLSLTKKPFVLNVNWVNCHMQLVPCFARVCHICQMSKCDSTYQKGPVGSEDLIDFLLLYFLNGCSFSSIWCKNFWNWTLCSWDMAISLRMT